MEKPLSENFRQSFYSSVTTKNSGRPKSNAFFPQTSEFDVKPRILESRVSTKEDFFNLSDGFKKIFAADKKDKNIVIPIAGYGGHRRGDRSQNFFGKSFRESSLQSKKLEREFRSPSVL